MFKPPVRNIDDCDTLDEAGLFRTLVTCHSLTFLEGSLSGDPLDVKMFEATHWEYMDDDQMKRNPLFEQACPVVKAPSKSQGDVEEIAIVKQFTFSASVLRMSVLCKSTRSNSMDVYCKGAPEKIVELCHPNTGLSSFIMHS